MYTLIALLFIFCMAGLLIAQHFYFEREREKTFKQMDEEWSRIEKAIDELLEKVNSNNKEE